MKGRENMDQDNLLNSAICCLLERIETMAKSDHSDSVDKSLPELVKATAELINSQYQ